jgi:ribosomal protein S27AE
MKVCKKCKVEKEITDFYKHSAMLDGHLNKCIDCVKARVNKYREINLDKVREYDKSRSNLPHRVQARMEYSKTEAYKESHHKSILKYREKYPMVRASHVIVGNAIRDKKLIPEQFCSVCKANEKIEAHHDDYTKPLEVRWLCKKCHTNWHKSNEAIYK